MAIPGHDWLDEADAYVDSVHYVIRDGKMDILFYSDNPASQAMFNMLQALLQLDCQAAKVRSNSESTPSRQQKGSGLKRARDSDETACPFNNRVNEQRAAAAAMLVENLLSFVIGAYILKTQATLQHNLHAAKYEAGAEHLKVAFTVNLPIASRHPGCLLVMGDLNDNHVWMPIQPTALSTAVDQLDVPDVADDGVMLAKAAAFIRACLHALTSYPTMPTINVHQGVSSRLLLR